MTAKEILGVGIRLLGVWFFIEALFLVSQTASFFAAAISTSEETYDWYKYFTLLETFLCFTVSYIFIRMPYGVSSLLIPKTHLDNTQIDWEEKLVERIGFVLMGVYILSWSIPDLVSNIGDYFFYKNLGGYEELAELTQTKIHFFVTVVEFGVGLLLTLSSRGIVNIIHKFRQYH
ncbi:MAG: hypothetical protein GY694_03085 [Gammaproteobacteria bacterium]|nr:hypothetical protein [Gammaproteobacteria bacterium]